MESPRSAAGPWAVLLWLVGLAGVALGFQFGWATLRAEWLPIVAAVGVGCAGGVVLTVNSGSSPPRVWINLIGAGLLISGLAGVGMGTLRAVETRHNERARTAEESAESSDESGQLSPEQELAVGLATLAELLDSQARGVPSGEPRVEVGFPAWQAERRVLRGALDRVAALARDGDDAARSVIVGADTDGLVAYLETRRDRANASDERARLDRDIAAIATARGDEDRAETALRRILAASPRDAGALANLGHLSLRTSELEAAESRYLALLGPAASPEAWAIGMGHLAAVHVVRGDLGEAERVVRESLEDRQRLGGDSWVALAHVDLAGVFAARGELDEARLELERAFEIARRQGRTALFAQICGAIGRVERQRGLLDEAVSSHETAIEIFSALDDRAGRAREQEALGVLQLERGDLRAAEGTILAAVTAYNTMRRTERVADLYATLSALYVARDEFSRAAHWLIQARDIHAASEDQEAVLRVHEQIAGVYTAAGELEFTERALRDGLRIASEMDDARHIARIQIALADALVTQGKRDEAQSLLESAAVLAETDGLDDLRGQAILWLGELGKEF
ncbi:MAG: tetratricopeptide repeat protein [Planctomycetota bacterium]